jgi:hypothetical protein
VALAKASWFTIDEEDLLKVQSELSEEELGSLSRGVKIGLGVCNEYPDKAYELMERAFIQTSLLINKSSCLARVMDKPELPSSFKTPI